MTSMIPPLYKVKTKSAQKDKLQITKRSTKCDTSYFEHAETSHLTNESLSTRKHLQYKAKPVQRRKVSMIETFHPIFHSYILDVVEVVANRYIVVSLRLREDFHDPLSEIISIKNLVNSVINMHH